VEMPFRSPRASYDAVRTSRKTRRLGVLLSAAALPLAAGCAANFSAQTQVQYQSAVGSDSRDSDIYALNMLVVGDGEGDGTLVGTLLNNDPTNAGCPDYLVDLQVVDSDGGGVENSALPAAEPVDAPDSCPAQSPEQGIALPSHQSVMLPDDATIQVAADTVQPGTFVTMTFTFQNSDPVEMDVPVVAEAAMYDGITVGPIATPTDDSATPSN
jgi:hypothetical protein